MKKYLPGLLLLYCLTSCTSFFHSSTMNKYYEKQKGFSWKSLQFSDFIMYYLPNSKTDKNPDSAKNKIEKGIAGARKFTKTDSIKTPIYYFIVDDKKEFGRLTKEEHTGLSFAKSNTIIESYFLLGESHEVVHLITYQNWGNSHTWIMEGMAVYSDSIWNGKNIDKLSLEYSQNNQLISVSELVKNKKFTHFDSQISYPQSGSLVKYLISTYGWEKFLQFWKKPQLEKTYHISPSTLQENWLNQLKNTYFSK